MTPRCGNCGAQLQLDANVRATKCPYCGSPLITDDDQAAGQDVITPEALVPFVITRQQARKQIHGMARFALVRARDCSKANRTSSNSRASTNPSGPTTPTLSATGPANAATIITSPRPIRRSKTASKSPRPAKVRQTRWTFVAGVYHDDFDDVACPCRKEQDLSGNYDLKGCKKYGPEYLSGFGAERYGRLRRRRLEERQKCDRRQHRRFSSPADRR